MILRRRNSNFQPEPPSPPTPPPNEQYLAVWFDAKDNDTGVLFFSPINGKDYSQTIKAYDGWYAYNKGFLLGDFSMPRATSYPIYYDWTHKGVCINEVSQNNDTYPDIFYRIPSDYMKASFTISVLVHIDLPNTGINNQYYFYELYSNDSNAVYAGLKTDSSAQVLRSRGQNRGVDNNGYQVGAYAVFMMSYDYDRKEAIFLNQAMNDDETVNVNRFDIWEDEVIFSLLRGERLQTANVDARIAMCDARFYSVLFDKDDMIDLANNLKQEYGF